MEDCFSSPRGEVLILSYENLDSVPTQTAGSSGVAAQDWNTYVRDNFDTLKRGHVRVANEAALAGLSTAIGTMVFAEAEESLWVNSSAGFVEVAKLGNTGAVSDAALPFLAPVGMVSPFAGASAPSGWLLCDGSALNASTNPQYTNLYSVIGVTYGGTNNTDFRVPNLAGRAPVGAGTGAQDGGSGTGAISGGTTWSETRGAWRGSRDVILTTAQMPSHTHIQDSHSHSYQIGGTSLGVVNSDDRPARAVPGISNPTHPGINATTATNQNTGGGQAHTNTQPILVVNYIIKF